ncbi:hypothetical protein Nepgr_012317 [Nepenthes gracilis]|uniref:EF-hand domain-containing protein n=1 Tax=Nepenthes gracilis TaxID=150966 RepID=A0AAD3SGR4_NEPGR|nr:hypothetical protein Nepgr_012317 [Nepenthes gracilis]
MSDGSLKVIDGVELRAADFSFPESGSTVAGAGVLELAESRASQSLYGLSLPESLKSSAFKRLNLPDDLLTFRGKEISTDQASRVLGDYITAMADELKDDPLLVAVLDGNTLKLFLDDEDDFAMLAESLFTDLDIEDEGKLSKSELRNALVVMGVEMGVPPFSEFPKLNEILKDHLAEGDEKLGQAQFAQLLQLVLQDLADALAEAHVVVIQNVKIINGSKLRKILVDEKQLNDVIEKIYQENLNGRKGRSCKEVIKSYFDQNCEKLGLPSSEANEPVSLLYADVFSNTDDGERSGSMDLQKNEFEESVKKILEKFADQLEECPVFHDLDN